VVKEFEDSYLRFHKGVTEDLVTSLNMDPMDALDQYICLKKFLNANSLTRLNPNYEYKSISDHS